MRLKSVTRWLLRRPFAHGLACFTIAAAFDIAPYLPTAQTVCEIDQPIGMPSDAATSFRRLKELLALRFLGTSRIVSRSARATVETSALLQRSFPRYCFVRIPCEIRNPLGLFLKGQFQTTELVVLSRNEGRCWIVDSEVALADLLTDAGFEVNNERDADVIHQLLLLFEIQGVHGLGDTMARVGADQWRIGENGRHEGLFCEVNLDERKVVQSMRIVYKPSDVTEP